MRRASLAFVGIAGPLVIAAACGSRTGLDSPTRHDASLDGTIDGMMDAQGDGPLFEGGALDVVTDCGMPPYCDPNDLGYIYQCGVRVYQCSSLEQCSMAKSMAQCVNPCLDTLGQDTSNGCEFYVAPIDISDQGNGACYAVYIVNQWGSGEPARIQVDRGGQILNVDQFARIPSGKGTTITYGPYKNANGLGKDQIAILFLSRDPNATGAPTDPKVLASCPNGIAPAVAGDPSVHGSGKGTAFHIKTNVPVVAYDIIPYGGGRSRIASASLLLPVNVWDSNYAVFNSYPHAQFASDGPELQVYARENGTNVWIRPTSLLPGGNGVPAAPSNKTTQYTLNAGEYIQFVAPNEFSGSPIESDKPVAVVGGDTLYQVPVGRQRADGGHQMLFPVSALGSEYVGVRFRSRNLFVPEEVPWRFVAIVDGTQLTYEPSTPAGAPTTLQAGDVAEFSAPGPFVVRSQDAAHPFAFAQYMTGGEFFDGEGDPEFINVLAPANYLPRYVFFTDPTYPETNLVLVRARDPQLGMPTVNLDCLGTIGGWIPVGNGGKYEFARVDLSKDNWNAVGNCDNGVHRIEGTFAGPDGGAIGVAKIAVTVWGWGSPRTYSGTDEADPLSSRWVSYGYTAGANITMLNSVKFPAK
jgi:hypothetical protein